MTTEVTTNETIVETTTDVDAGVKDSTKTLEDALSKIAHLEEKNNELEATRNKAATKLRIFEKEAEQKAQQLLEEEGKWKELAEASQAKLSTLETQLDTYRVDSVLDAQLLAAFGEVNVTTAKSLLDRTLIQRDESGNVIVESIVDAITKVKEQHPILSGDIVKPTPSVVTTDTDEHKGGYIEELKALRENPNATKRQLEALRAKYGKEN